MVGGRQVVHAHERVGVVGPQLLLQLLEDLQIQRLGLVEGVLVLGLQRVGAALALDRFRNRDRGTERRAV
jgi:hypothetical protein